MKKIRIRGKETPSFWNKCFRIMKLTTLFFLIGLIQLSASVYSQSAKLTLEMRNKKVIEVLEEIEKQSEFRFAYSSELIDLERKVSVELSERNIEETLNVIFDETNVKHVVYDRHIMLYPKEMDSYTETEFISNQQNTISGTVTDENGLALPGVTVIIKGTTQGTVTNTDGNYSISNIPENATLVFSFVGMRTQEIMVGNKTTIDIQLEVDAVGIEEVIAVGYGVQRKVNMTGAVSMINFDEEIENRPITNASQALSGKIPGIWVSQNSGKPGSDGAQIRVRGWGTLNNSNPLVIIDGIEGDIDQLNPHDIESVYVLKDAASSAIYGSKAANGVILITTKTGKTNERMQVNLSSYYGIQALGKDTIL